METAASELQISYFHILFIKSNLVFCSNNVGKELEIRIKDTYNHDY